MTIFLAQVNKRGKKMRCMDRVKVWNHTLSGKLVEEGIGTLRRKDPDFVGESIDVLFDQGELLANETTKRVEGKFERWMVTFPAEGKEVFSRWVRKEDVIHDVFEKANKQLAMVAKELNKIL